LDHRPTLISKHLLLLVVFLATLIIVSTVRSATSLIIGGDVKSANATVIDVDRLRSRYRSRSLSIQYTANTKNDELKEFETNISVPYVDGRTFGMGDTITVYFMEHSPGRPYSDRGTPNTSLIWFIIGIGLMFWSLPTCIRERDVLQIVLDTFEILGSNS